MSALKEMFDAMGFAGARTVLQSGSIIFAAPAHKPAALEAMLERETERRFKVRPDYFVRTVDEWREALAANPFLGEAKSDPARLHVLALKAQPSVQQLRDLEAAIKGRETVALGKRHAYAYFPGGAGNSKLTPRLIETKLGTRATGRNWNTSQKLLAPAEG